MPASQLKTRQRKRSIDVLRKNFDDVADAVDELADALEAGEADPELVADTFVQLAASAVSISDASMTADVIDDTEDRWRAIDDLRGAMYHAADAIGLEETDRDVIAPTPERSRNAALSDATAAAEYLEIARDGVDQ